MAEHGHDSPKLFLAGKPITGFVECHEHISPPSLYVKVLAALLFLTGLTYAVSFADLGPASLPVALVVAVMKATLVCTFFMHLRHDDRFHLFIFVSTVLFVGIFFTFTIFDLQSRAELSDTQDTFYRRSGGDWSDVQHTPTERRPGAEPKAAHSKAGAEGKTEGKAAPAKH